MEYIYYSQPYEYIIVYYLKYLNINKIYLIIYNFVMYYVIIMNLWVSHNHKFIISSHCSQIDESSTCLNDWLKQLLRFNWNPLLKHRYTHQSNDTVFRQLNEQIKSIVKILAIFTMLLNFTSPKKIIANTLWIFSRPALMTLRFNEERQ